MKTTKKISIFVLLFAGLMMPTIQSCKKYPDGPSISLRSRTARVANSWRVERYLKNGIDQTGNFIASKSNYVEIFTKENNWSFVYLNTSDGKIKSGGGTWHFINDDKQILRTEGGDNQLLHIMRLKQNEFWYYYMDGSDTKEFHLVSN